MKAATSALSVCFLAIGVGVGCNSPDGGAPDSIATSTQAVVVDQTTYIVTQLDSRKCIASVDQKDPVCPGPGVQCFVDPCMNQTAICLAGRCALASK